MVKMLQGMIKKEEDIMIKFLVHEKPWKNVQRLGKARNWHWEKSLNKWEII